MDAANIDQWLSTKAARGVHEFPPDLELASALELCNTISSEELSFQHVCNNYYNITDECNVLGLNFQDLDDILVTQEIHNKRKKEMLYQK